MKDHRRSSRTWLRNGAVAAGVGGLVAAGAPAFAAMSTGTWGCAGQFAYLTATTQGYTELDPPGSDFVWVFSTGGERTRQALATDYKGTPVGPKKGGGSWSAYGYVSVTDTDPYCSSYGE